MTRFKAHHFAISVRDLDATAAFYGILGFRLCLRWIARDGSLTIAHFADEDGVFLEAFQFAANASAEPLGLTMGNDLPAVGVKHCAFAVADLTAARDEFLAKGFDTATPIRRGRTEMDFFFVRDPDGLWVEIAYDDRELDADWPVVIREP